jgi:hypothetical protein
MNRAIAFDRDRSGQGMKFCGARDFLYRRRSLRVGARDQNIVRGFRAQHSANDLDDLPGGFALRENDFRKTLAKRAMMVNLREAEIFIGKLPEPLDSGIGRQLAAPYGFEKISNVAFVHWFSRSDSLAPISKGHSRTIEDNPC